MPERFERTTLAKKRYINTLPFLFLSFTCIRTAPQSVGTALKTAKCTLHD